MQLSGNTIALTVVAAALALFAGFFLVKGVGYGGQPIHRVTRAEDPFTFWIWVGIPGAAALFLAASALVSILAR